jgi:SRSO17 transposase
VPRGTVLADPAYGSDTGLRESLAGMELGYMVGVQSTTTFWPPGAGPIPPPSWKGRRQPATRVRRYPEHVPVTAKQPALYLPGKAWKTVTWREGSRRPLRSRFAAQPLAIIRLLPSVAITTN